MTFLRRHLESAIALFNQTTLEGPDLEIYPRYPIALFNHDKGLNVICLCFDMEFHWTLNMIWIFWNLRTKQQFKMSKSHEIMNVTVVLFHYSTITKIRKRYYKNICIKKYIGRPKLWVIPSKIKTYYYCSYSFMEKALIRLL